MLIEKSAAPLDRLAGFIGEFVEPRWGGCEVIPLPGDASTRRYFRLTSREGASLIAAVYPESFDSDHFTYRQVYSVLRSIGVPVPESHVFDGARGVVLQQDLGDEWLLARLNNTPRAQWRAPLRQAMEWIARIQSEGTRRCPPEYAARQLSFDREKLAGELRFFFEQYLTRHRALLLGDSEQAALYSEFETVSGRLAEYPRHLTHRDYHCRNIMLFASAQYIIDFQDARMGPASYDLVSLLKDSVDLPQAAIDELVSDFLALGHLGAGEVGEFHAQFELMSVQRLLKALGTYGYQISVRGNPVYTRYIPGTLRRAHASAARLGFLPATLEMLERELGSQPEQAEPPGEKRP